MCSAAAVHAVLRDPTGNLIQKKSSVTVCVCVCVSGEEYTNYPGTLVLCHLAVSIADPEPCRLLKKGQFVS